MTRSNTSIYIAFGGNLPSAHGSPRDTLEAALKALACEGISIVSVSQWYATAPVPRSDQPDYINGAAEVCTHLGPEALLAALHRIEDRFGRVRVTRNEARAVDLDLIDYAGRVTGLNGEGLILPHPRAHLRAFVLVPLRDIAPEWHHPVTGQSIDALIGGLLDVEDVRRL